MCSNIFSTSNVYRFISQIKYKHIIAVVVGSLGLLILILLLTGGGTKHHKKYNEDTVMHAENLIMKDEDSACKRIVPLVSELLEKYQGQISGRLGELTEISRRSGNESDETGIACPVGYLCVPKKQKQYGNYLGCFEDHIQQRMFRGYMAFSGSMTHEKCMSACVQHRYIYAGLQNRDWCHCGNMAPQPGLNDKASESNCKKDCSGNSVQYCGGAEKMRVYETGIEHYRFDEHGQQIDESVAASDHKWVLKDNCEVI